MQCERQANLKMMKERGAGGQREGGGGRRLRCVCRSEGECQQNRIDQSVPNRAKPAHCIGVKEKDVAVRGLAPSWRGRPIAAFPAGDRSDIITCIVMMIAMIAMIATEKPARRQGGSHSSQHSHTPPRSPRKVEGAVAGFFAMWRPQRSGIQHSASRCF